MACWRARSRRRSWRRGASAMRIYPKRLYRSITSSRSSTRAWPDTSHRPWSDAASDDSARHVRRFSGVLNLSDPHQLPWSNTLQGGQAFGDEREQILDSIRTRSHDQNRDRAGGYLLLKRDALIQRQQNVK